jgi:hypothetical protein
MTEHRTPAPTIVPATPIEHDADTRLLKRIPAIRPALADREPAAVSPDLTRRQAA